MATEDLRAVAFPKLTPDEIAKVARCVEAPLERHRAGEALVRCGECAASAFVVVSGELEVRDESGTESRVIAVYGPGDFTGEVSTLAGARSFVSTVARSDCEVYTIAATSLQQVINREPMVGDKILQAFIARRQLLGEQTTFAGLRLIGSRHTKDTFRVRELLTKNHVPFLTLDLEGDPEVKKLLERFGVTEAETPIVAIGRGHVLRNPSNAELAAAIGIRHPLEAKVYDLIIIGAGPAGLAAAVYGASEGLDTLVLEQTAPGGQAARSMRIENYLGFPTGITGAELAERAAIQAAKFGAHLPVAVTVTRLSFENRYVVVEVDGGEKTWTKCLIIASGAEYRRLEAADCERFEGRGVYYAATPVEAPICRGVNAVVVGGGNSAGQAAVFLSSLARRVYVVVRGESLSKSMSSYLVQRIEKTPNIEVLLDTRVRRMIGDEVLHAVEVVNDKTKEARTLETPGLFSFIGAAPRTEWLPAEIEKDDKGFVTTGRAASRSSGWSHARSPFVLETTRAGVFAAGDVRSGSIKRVASGVGEGAMAVALVHEYLKTM
jgi:thioredoxin reductase (NADPH)